MYTGMMIVMQINIEITVPSFIQLNACIEPQFVFSLTKHRNCVFGGSLVYVKNGKTDICCFSIFNIFGLFFRFPICIFFPGYCPLCIFTFQHLVYPQTTNVRLSVFRQKMDICCFKHRLVSHTLGLGDGVSH